MIIFKKKVWFIPVRECWYNAKIRLPDFFLCCVYFNIQPKCITSKFIKSFAGKTIVISLQEATSKIFSGFSKQTKNCIRQAEKCKMEAMFDTPVASFVEFYNLFAVKKKLNRISAADFDHLNGAFQLCHVSYNGEVCAMHFYLLDKDSGQVQLFRSASRRLFDDSIEKNIVGKANKYLHCTFPYWQWRGTWSPGKDPVQLHYLLST